MMEWYICLSCTWQWLFIRFDLFQSHSILAHPPSPVYSFIFHSRSMLLQAWEFFLALGYEHMPVQASIRCWPWRWDSPITAIYVICMPSFVRVMCAFKYASTKDGWKSFDQAWLG